MSESSDVAQSAEAIAYRLYNDVRLAEGKGMLKDCDKAYLLNTFQDCIRATRLVYDK